MADQERTDEEPMEQHEKHLIELVDDETVAQGRIDELDVTPTEKLERRAQARHDLDEALEVPPRPPTTHA